MDTWKQLDVSNGRRRWSLGMGTALALGLLVLATLWRGWSGWVRGGWAAAGALGGSGSGERDRSSPAPTLRGPAC